MNKAVDAYVKIHDARLISLIAQVRVRQFSLFVGFGNVETMRLVHVRMREIIDALVIAFLSLDRAIFRKVLFFFFRKYRGVIAVLNQIVITAVADERHHHGKIVFIARVFFGKIVYVLGKDFAVPVQIDELSLVVIALQPFHGIQKMRVVESVQIGKRFVPAVIIAVVRVKIIGRITAFLQNIGKGKIKRMSDQPLRIADGGSDRIFDERGITAQNRHRLGMIGLIARTYRVGVYSPLIAYHSPDSITMSTTF